VTRFRPPMRFSCREAGLAPWSGPRFRTIQVCPKDLSICSVAG
jgi:hypothetical protein